MKKNNKILILIVLVSAFLFVLSSCASQREIEIAGKTATVIQANKNIQATQKQKTAIINMTQTPATATVLPTPSPTCVGQIVPLINGSVCVPMMSGPFEMQTVVPAVPFKDISETLVAAYTPEPYGLNNNVSSETGGWLWYYNKDFVAVGQVHESASFIVKSGFFKIDVWVPLYDLQTSKGKGITSCHRHSWGHRKESFHCHGFNSRGEVIITIPDSLKFSVIGKKTEMTVPNPEGKSEKTLGRIIELEGKYTVNP